MTGAQMLYRYFKDVEVPVFLAFTEQVLHDMAAERFMRWRKAT